MEKRFEGKAGIVTGGASGIGRATALAFAREGAKVWITDVQEKEGLSIVEQIRKEGGLAFFHACDVSDARQVETMVDQERLKNASCFRLSLRRGAIISALHPYKSLGEDTATLAQHPEKSFVNDAQALLQAAPTLTSVALVHMDQRDTLYRFTPAQVDSLKAALKKAFVSESLQLTPSPWPVALVFGITGVSERASRIWGARWRWYMA